MTRFFRWFVIILGCLIAVYLVGRAVVELVTIKYSLPSSYQHDWGGPHLAGVLAVHAGPGVLVLAGAAWRVVRRKRGLPTDD